MGCRLTGSVGVIPNAGHGRSGGVGGVAVSRGQACAVAISVLTTPQDLLSTRVCPHVEILDDDVGARDVGRAVDLDRAALHAIGGSSGPGAEADVRLRNAVTIGGIHGRPGGVKVQGVCVGVAHEVVEGDVLHGAGATVRLDHVHLV